MTKYPYKEAKESIQAICHAAMAQECKSQDAFFSLMSKYPHIAIQGYNSRGIISYWSAQATELYGYSEAEAIGRNLFELILPPEIQKLATDMIASAERTGMLPESSPCDLLRATGELVAVYSGHIMFQWGEEPEFFCIDLAIGEEIENA